MTIILFLIDTSASMNQRAFLGGRPKLLDIARGAVETFVKARQKYPDGRGDRYMLVTFEDPPFNVKAGWKENLSTFMNELKNLQCNGMTTIGSALKQAFDLLNINRIQTGIDTYGQGRNPYFLECVFIVVITDGGKLSNSNGIQEEFNLPMHSPVLGSELTREPFRWDQRLFALVLRLSGVPTSDKDTGMVPSDNSQIDTMCEVTGGRSYCITTHRMLLQCVESLVQKVQQGVVINFEKIGPDPPPVHSNPNNGNNEVMYHVENGNGDREPDPRAWERDAESVRPPNHAYIRNNHNHVHTAWQSCRKLIYVQRNIQKLGGGYWPIPESYWPDPSLTVLPPRTAHPNIKFSCVSHEPIIIDNLPFDKYELEPSPLTQYMLARKQPNVAWQVFVPNSGKNPDVMLPFGYLKASTNLTCVNMFVMPYNYPALFPLLDEFIKVHRMKVAPEWRNQFQNYLRNMPAYYAAPLRRALEKMGVTKGLAQNLVPDLVEKCYHFSVLNFLKTLKQQGKMEFDKLCNEISNKQTVNTMSSSNTSEFVRVSSRGFSSKDLISHPALQRKFKSLKDQVADHRSHAIAVSRGRCEQVKSGYHQSYRNPFDIQRKSLLDQVFRMRSNFLQKNLIHTKLLDEDVCHSVPVGQMGNYQEYLKRMPSPLREIESAPVRQHLFGNPFKIDKRMVIDEADIDFAGGNSSTRSPLRRTGEYPQTQKPPLKRKPGPLPRHVTAKRPALSADSSPATSPESSRSSTPVPFMFLSSPYPSRSPSPQHPPTPDVIVIPDDEPELETEFELTPGVSQAVIEEKQRKSPSPPPLEVLASTGVDSDDNNYREETLPPPSLAPFSEVGSNNVAATQNPYLLINREACCSNSDNDENVAPYFGIANTSNVATATAAATVTVTSTGGGGNSGIGNSNNPVVPPRQVKRLHRQEIEVIKKLNLKIRTSLYKEVRRYGKDYSKVFEYLDSLKGPREMKICIIKDVIEESLRFKRAHLANALERFIQNMPSDDNGLVQNGLA